MLLFAKNALAVWTICFKLGWRDNLEQNSPSCQVALKTPVLLATQKYSHQQILETSFVLETIFIE